MDTLQSTRRAFLLSSGATCALAAMPAAARTMAAVQGSDQLVQSFSTPPMASRPSIWWYWGESVTTEQGITQDLEALKRVGFGGVVIYEQTFENRPDAFKSLSPEWMARVRFAAAECSRLGMALEINVSGGYVSGGPWITPELGMQRLVASELQIEGGKPFAGQLPQPETKLGFYKDVVCCAYPSPAGSLAATDVRYASEPDGIDLPLLFDPTSQNRVRISPLPDGRPVLIALNYDRPFTARSLTFRQRQNSKSLVIATQVAGNWADDFYGQSMRLNPALGHLEASVDGVQWTRICELPALGSQHDYWDQLTVAFPATTARHFRLNLQGWGHNARQDDEDLLIGAVQLHGDARVDRWESKSGNFVDFSNPDETPAYVGDEVIDPKKIIDVTSHLSEDGSLRWTPPAGRWTILRLGHTPTGAGTKHGPPEVMGKESDKLSARATRVQFDNYVGKILREIRKVPGARLAGVNIDSAEHGSQNWTADFIAQFKTRRGYDPIPYLPAMMGRVIASREVSDGFLFDVRRTIADLMSDEYFGAFQKLCHAEGLTSMAQAPGIATCLPSDNIQAKGRTDIPMGEFWMSQPDGTIDCKEAASAGHVYGLPVIAAESFTGSNGDIHPGVMKPFADAALSLGVNRFVVLAGIHQPDDRKPGVSQDRVLMPYQRHNTWWEYSAGFWNTLGRSSHMMRQGLPVIDILYHLGNDTPLKIATSRMRPAPPKGYDYDVCGDEILLKADVKNGRVVLPSGMSYALLVLAGGQGMTRAAARKVAGLAAKGATILGPVKPNGSPSLADAAAGQAEVRRVADELWPQQPARRRVISGATAAAVLAKLDIPKDFELIDGGGAKILYMHRRTKTEDIYFLANHLAKSASVTARFRVTGRTPQRWNPQTGQVKAFKNFRVVGGQTEISIKLESYDSLFVVFRDAPSPPADLNVLVSDVPIWRNLAKDWDVHFDPKWGAPEHVSFPDLASWTQNADSGVRHYSGTARYVQVFDVAKLPTGPVWLDLGDVQVVADVTLNGKALGPLWKRPYAVDITHVLLEGRNRLEVKVANLWANRLIADIALPESQRVAWTTFKGYKATDPLRPSGLIGPVVLRSA